jgi:hypothetical protein
VFTALNAVRGRYISASIDLFVTLGLWGVRHWSDRNPARCTIAAHLGGVLNGGGLTIVSLIQGQSAAMARGFVASPFYAGYTLERVARIGPYRHRPAPRRAFVRAGRSNSTRHQAPEI